VQEQQRRPFATGAHREACLWGIDVLQGKSFIKQHCHGVSL
jgi:hypothetical protein